jgi:hypothetical protein
MKFDSQGRLVSPSGQPVGVSAGGDGSEYQAAE